MPVFQRVASGKGVDREKQQLTLRTHAALALEELVGAGGGGGGSASGVVGAAAAGLLEAASSSNTAAPFVVAEPAAIVERFKTNFSNLSAPHMIVAHRAYKASALCRGDGICCCSSSSSTNSGGGLEQLADALATLDRGIGAGDRAELPSLTEVAAGDFAELDLPSSKPRASAALEALAAAGPCAAVALLLPLPPRRWRRRQREQKAGRPHAGLGPQGRGAAGRERGAGCAGREGGEGKKKTV